jgi:hypothetical protein
VHDGRGRGWEERIDVQDAGWMMEGDMKMTRRACIDKTGYRYILIYLHQ